MSQAKHVAALVIVAALGGCATTYPEERPDVNKLDARDKGLQSLDLMQCSDKMTQDLLAFPGLNTSQKQWLIVFGHMDNQTGENPTGNFDIFLNRLKTNLSQQGYGRITLIANKQPYHQLQSQELENAPDQNQQGPGGVAAGPAGLQPDYELNGVVQDLPNRGTDTYRFEFSLTGLQGPAARTIPWTRDYIVKVAR